MNQYLIGLYNLLESAKNDPEYKANLKYPCLAAKEIAEHEMYIEGIKASIKLVEGLK